MDETTKAPARKLEGAEAVGVPGVRQALLDRRRRARDERGVPQVRRVGHRPRGRELGTTAKTETREERATALYRKTFNETEGDNAAKDKAAGDAVQDEYGDEWELNGTGDGAADVEVIFLDEEGDIARREIDHEIACDEDGENFLIDGVGFANPGQDSALRAATRSNPRNLPCPTCGAENVLTPADRANGYQCDGCADAAEGRGY